MQAQSYAHCGKMSTRSKGRKSELLAKKKLEEEGWLVHLTDMPQKFKKSQDILGCWDIIAVRDGCFKLVQVRTNQWGDVRPQKAFKDEYFYNHNFVSCEIWKWVGKERRFVRRYL